MACSCGKVSWAGQIHDEVRWETENLLKYEPQNRDNRCVLKEIMYRRFLRYVKLAPRPWDPAKSFFFQVNTQSC